MIEELLMHFWEQDLFVNIVPSSKTLSKGNYETDVGNENEPILNYLSNFKNNPSLKCIKSRRKKSKCLLLIMFLIKKLLTKFSKAIQQSIYFYVIFISFSFFKLQQ